MNSFTSFERNVATTGMPPRRIAFVQACWHKEIVDRCKAGFIDTMTQQGYEKLVDFYEVPGAFELPLYAKELSASGAYDAIVAAGLIVDGGIYRHDFVAQTVIQALMQVHLETRVPILSAVLTPHHFHAGPEHSTFFSDHFVVKGIEAANACLQIIPGLCTVRTLSVEAGAGEASWKNKLRSESASHLRCGGLPSWS